MSVHDMNSRDSKTIRDLLSEAGLSEAEISGLFAKGSLEKTRQLISMYSTRSNSIEKLKIISVIHYIGDLELTADFYADILQTGSHEEKFNAAVHAEFERYNGHHRLREALQSHLQGLSALDALIRDSTWK